MSLATQPWQPLSRSDRHVRRASLRLPAGVSEHRAAFLVEEALRLMALPGEQQGRTYFFRRVALRGLAAAAPPSEWIERAQSTMHALAVRALHGANPRATDSDAVFFNSHAEALEWLLRRLFLAFPREGSTAVWFAPMISPTAGGTDAPMQVVAVIERLRSLPAGWFAAATVLLGAVEDSSGAITMLESIPERVLRAWLSELGGSSGRSGHLPRISDARRRMLSTHLAGQERAAPSYWRSRGEGIATDISARPAIQHRPPPHLLLLATLVVVAEHPGELAYRSALVSGQAILDDLVESIDRAAAEDCRDQDALSSLQSAEASPDVLAHKRAKSPMEGALREGPEAREEIEPDADRTFDYSRDTAAGGLYFLLNALRQLGIETAFDALPAPLVGVFLPMLIDSLARASDVAQTDPARSWITVALDALDQDEALEGTIFASACWPRTLIAPPEIDLTPVRLIRVWTLAVRRWCWLNARLTLREIVSRPGRILLTRTDLDVTLSMDTVDLRLRRIGLDLDPGWLPWFGRVVRFHYVNAPSRTGIDGRRIRNDLSVATADTRAVARAPRAKHLDLRPLRARAGCRVGRVARRNNIRCGSS